MVITANTVSGLVEAELAVLKDLRVVEHIRGLLVLPEPIIRAWDYGRPDEAYPYWSILNHAASNTGIAYCEFGFGPQSPWGLVSLKGSEHMSMGMDSGWFTHFLDAYFESHASSDLPIWRAYEQKGSEFPGTPITDEAPSAVTWEVVMRLRKENPQWRYNHWQSVYRNEA
jgi:hypothetical protein